MDAPPPGPPPPRVPEGWKAVWNSQYSEWFFVNIHTKASQWDKPTAPAPDPNNPTYAPPSYASSNEHLTPNHPPEKSNPNNPYNPRPQSPNDIDADARYAAQLQAEEDARAAAARSPHGGNLSSSRGAADSYYSSGPGGAPPSPQPPMPQQQYDQPQQKRGLLDRLTGRSNKPSYQGQGNYPPQQGGGYGGYGGPPGQQGGYYGGGPQPGYGGYGGPPQPGYGGYGGGIPQQQYVQQQPQKKSGFPGGAGGAVLGAGAGLVGGALLMDAFENHEDFEQEQAYQQGYDQGQDNDNGGGDMGGGDMGDGGGDF